MTINPRRLRLNDHGRRSRHVRCLPVVALMSVVLLATGCASGSPGASQRPSAIADSAGTSTPVPTTPTADPESSMPPVTTPTTAPAKSSTLHATARSTSPGVSNIGAGPIIRAGTAAGSGPGGNETTGSYTVVFAECMRAHGVPKFPDPNGSGMLPGPDSGIDPSSAAFQAALNGPCQSLAPAGWVSSGPVTK
jgi:hypothetical protein